MALNKTLCENFLKALVNQGYTDGNVKTGTAPSDKYWDIVPETYGGLVIGTPVSTNVTSFALADIALFKTLPVVGSDGTITTQPTEVTLSGYARKPLYGKGISGIDQFGTLRDAADATSVNPYFNTTEQKMCIENTDEIQMHAIAEDETGTEDVYGFGIYGYNVINDGAGKGGKNGTGRLLAWGNLVNAQGVATHITLEAGSVPIFYKGDLKIYIG